MANLFQCTSPTCSFQADVLGALADVETLRCMVCGAPARRCVPQAAWTPVLTAAATTDSFLSAPLKHGASAPAAPSDSPSSIDLDADWLKKLATPDESTIVQNRLPAPGDTAATSLPPPTDAASSTSPPPPTPRDSQPRDNTTRAASSHEPTPPTSTSDKSPDSNIGRRSSHSGATSVGPQPIVDGEAVFGRATLSADAVELRVEGGIHAKHFDYSRGRLVIQHERRGIERLSAWSLEDWRPVDPSLGFDPAKIAEHELTATLSAEKEYSLEIVRSTTNPAGSFWKVAVSEPSRGFGVDRRRIQLIWDMTRGQWVGGVEGRETDDTHFHMGGRHLAMTGGQGAKSLRIAPWTDAGPVDLAHPLAEKQLGPGPLSLAFAPDDSYVVAQRGPLFLPDQTLREPLRLTALQPESAEPIWERSYLCISGQANIPWQCLGTWLSPQSELLGIVLTREPQPRYLLYDLATGRRLAPPILVHSRLKMAVAVSPRHGLAAFIREPNILEVWQFGVAAPLLQIDFDVAQPGSTGRVGAQLCPEGRYLAVHFTDRPLLQIYRIDFAGPPIVLRSHDEASLCPPANNSLDDGPRRKRPEAPPASDPEAAAFSIDHLIDGPVEQPAAPEPQRRRRTRPRRQGLQPLETFVLWSLALGLGYFLSVGPVAANFPRPPGWLIQCYAPHRALAHQAKIAQALRNWCVWWRVPDEAYAVYFGVKLVASQEETATPEVARAGVSPNDVEPAPPAPASVKQDSISKHSATSPPSNIDAVPVSADDKSSSEPNSDSAPRREVRLWTDKYGRMVEAVLLRVENNEVIFELPSGQLRKTPISRLSVQDQEYVRGRQ